MGESVRVDAFVASVGAFPQPPVEVLFDGVKEMLADDVRAPLGLAVAVAGVRVDVDLSGLALDAEVVRELALLALFTDALLEVGAEDGLGILALLDGLLLDEGDTLEE